jgi:hypothetical protein
MITTRAKGSCAERFFTLSDISRLGSGRRTLRTEQHKMLNSGMFSVILNNVNAYGVGVG